MKAVKNTETGILEIVYAATLKSIGSTVRTTNNDKATPYRLCTAEVEYPNGTKAAVGCMLWEGSNIANEGSFFIGAEISLRVQAEGEYAGNATVQLPAMAKFDLGLVEFEVEEVAPVGETA